MDTAEVDVLLISLGGCRGCCSAVGRYGCLSKTLTKVLGGTTLLDTMLLILTSFDASIHTARPRAILLGFGEQPIP